MSKRYQDEIEEILKKAGDLEPAPRRPDPEPTYWQLIAGYFHRFVGGRKLLSSSGRVMLAGISLLLVGLLFTRVVPGIGALVAVVAVVLLISGYGMALAKPRKVEKRWRGRVIEEDESWWSRFRKKSR